MITRWCYALAPLLILLLAIGIACVLAYGLVLSFDNMLPLRKLVSKGTLILLVLSIIPAMRYLKLSTRQLGFAPWPQLGRQIAQGLILGLVTLLPVFVVLYALDISILDHSQHWTGAKLAEKLGITLLLALLIAFIEEPLFRGILFVGLRRKLTSSAALVISACYYATLHFLDTKTLIPEAKLKWWSGLQLVGEAFANLSNPGIMSAWLALFMVGIFLGLVRTRLPNSLGLCIGCHAAWVWQIKMNKSIFDTQFTADYAYLVSRYDGVIGPLVTGWLLLALLGWSFAVRSRMA